MIKANQLRIGNCVEYFEKYLQVTGIESISGTYYIRGYGKPTIYYNHIDAYRPIKLTPKLLALLEDYTFENGDSIGLGKDAEGHYFFMAAGEYKISKNLRYLHELQNLYFALTGKELDLKL